MAMVYLPTITSGLIQINPQFTENGVRLYFHPLLMSDSLSLLCFMSFLSQLIFEAVFGISTYSLPD